VDGVVKMIQMGVNTLPEKDPLTVCHPSQKIDPTHLPRILVPIMRGQMIWVRIIHVDLALNSPRRVDFNYRPRLVNLERMLATLATILDHIKLRVRKRPRICK
jgi:hypothetical protein